MIIKLSPENNKSILMQLQERNVPIPAACGGIGRCGRCRIRLVEGELPVTPDDLKVLGRERCEAGWRLACRAYATGAVSIEVKLPEEAQILTRVQENEPEAEKTITLAGTSLGAGAESDTGLSETGKLYAAVDIGTTTVVIILYDYRGRELAKSAFLNPQAAFGADVISRISAANEVEMSAITKTETVGKAEKMRELLIRCISDELQKCIIGQGRNAENLGLIAVAGNTTMLHLFRGYSLAGMMAHPFMPVSLEFENLTATECGLPFEKARVHIFPGISAFVGADIVAGIYGCNIHQNSEYQLLMDLGTNGEMALGNYKAIKVSAAAAGPAFEGGNLSCGMGCVRGAVDSVKLACSGQQTRAVCHVIGGTQAEGLCGSGAVELLAEALKAAIIGNDGTLTDEYFEKGLIFAADADGTPLSLTQKDIRELQLAKASVRAVAEMLIKSFEKNIGQIHIKLAGGMGNGLNLEAIQTIGLVPERGELEAAGNTCLLGLQKYITAVASGMEEHARSELKTIIEITSEIPVAGEPAFQQEFLRRLPFTTK